MPERRSVLVTGGASGIGLAISRRLAKDGYHVTIAGRNADVGNQVAKEINGLFVQTDVTQPEQVARAVKAAADANNGVLHALVNNAGIVGPQQKYGEYDIEKWKQIIDVNLNGVFYGLKYGLAQMASQEEGGGYAIVNMSSTAGNRGIPNLGPYTAAKFALQGMTMAAAVEYGPQQIRVNAVAPTATETSMMKDFLESASDPDALKAVVTGMQALHGMVQPDDVAGATAFLLSHDARYITGHTLPVTGGALAKLG